MANLQVVRTDHQDGPATYRLPAGALTGYVHHMRDYPGWEWYVYRTSTTEVIATGLCEHTEQDALTGCQRWMLNHPEMDEAAQRRLRQMYDDYPF